MKIVNSIYETIGKTPLLKLNNYMKKHNLKANILAKLECFNPAGSIKDRVGFFLLSEAEKRGEINKDTVIIEPTSGNTGIGLASVAASKGMKVILTMPDSMSKERIALLKAYGAEIVLTPGAEGMQGAVKKAEELKKSYENSFIPGQFVNTDNLKTHINSTGPELLEATDNKTDIFVAGIGTGGTITGCGKYLKSKLPDVKVIGVEPEDSPLITKGVAGPHKLQGIGANFVPEILDLSVIDEIITADTENAIKAAKDVAHLEGVLVGISSGAALFAATLMAKREENANKNIVVILPDSGERYMSTGMFE